MKPMKSRCIRCLSLLLLFHVSVGLAASPTCKPPGKGGDWKAWLALQAKKGGHAQRCHVNVGQQGLINRLTDGGSGNKSGVCAPNGNAASSWSSDKHLIDALKQVVPEKWEEVWGRGAGNHSFEGSSGTETIGLVVTKAEKKAKSGQCHPGFRCKEAHNWRVVFKRTQDDCYLLTAYPE